MFGSSAAFCAHSSACCKQSRICSLRLFNMVLGRYRRERNHLSATDARIFIGVFLPVMMNPTLLSGDSR